MICVSWACSSAASHHRWAGDRNFAMLDYVHRNRSPPVGLNVYPLGGGASLGLQGPSLIIMIAVPPISTFLPSKMFGDASTAPPISGRTDRFKCGYSGGVARLQATLPLAPPGTVRRCAVTSPILSPALDGYHEHPPGKGVRRHSLQRLSGAEGRSLLFHADLRLPDAPHHESRPALAATAQGTDRDLRVPGDLGRASTVT